MRLGADVHAAHRPGTSRQASPTDGPTSTRPQGGLYRHRLDPVSGLFGLVFLVIGLMTLIVPDGHAGLDLGLVISMVGIAAGLGLILSMVWGEDSSPSHEAALEPSQDPIPTPEAVAQEDREWFGLDMPLSDVEREVLEAIEDGESTS